MPASLNVAVGRQAEVRLERAVLLYGDGHGGDAFATVHDVTGVAEGRPALAPGRLLTVAGLREIHGALYRQGRLAVLPPNVLALGPGRLAWFEPARPRALFFASGDLFLDGLSGHPLPQPPLLFIGGERALKVFALSEDERPSGSSRVFTAPYYNTSAGGVCLGSTPLPTTLSPDDTGSYADAFFHSAFTHPTAERLVRGWGGSYGELWAGARAAGRFPLAHLVPLDKTVEEVVNA